MESLPSILRNIPTGKANKMNIRVKKTFETTVPRILENPNQTGANGLKKPGQTISASRSIIAGRTRVTLLLKKAVNNRIKTTARPVSRDWETNCLDFIVY